MAHAMVQRQHDDLILCDVSMPGMNGLTLLPSLRSSAPHASVVMMSGDLDLDVQQKAMNLGATTILLKPFDRLPLTVVFGKFGKTVVPQKQASCGTERGMTPTYAVDSTSQIGQLPSSRGPDRTPVRKRSVTSSQNHGNSNG